LIGNFKNGGTDYRPKGDPQRVNVHDFEDKKLGKVLPYGVYDVTANAGCVSVEIASDTAEFAVQSIRCWHARMRRKRYRRTTRRARSSRQRHSSNSCLAPSGVGGASSLPPVDRFSLEAKRFARLVILRWGADCRTSIWLPAHVAHGS
jgi:hypothetical protein